MTGEGNVLMKERTMVNGHKVREATEMKRRMVMQGLSIRPKELRQLFGFTGPKVSWVLNGHRCLTEEEQHRLASLVLRRMQELFS